MPDYPTFPTRLRLTLLAGYTGLEHPPQLRDGIAGRDGVAIADQHRVGGCAERRDLADHHIAAVGVHRVHRLRASEAAARPTAPASPLVAGPIRHGREYRGAVFPPPHLSLCILPAVDTRHSRDHELGGGHVRWRHRVGLDLLLGQGATPLHSARRLSQTGRGLTSGVESRVLGNFSARKMPRNTRDPTNNRPSCI